MERADIKRVLKELGVHEALTEMPAVVEPIYKEMMERPESDLRKEGKVVVDEHGNFTLGDKKIRLRRDKCAEITFGDAQITTNAVGIEIEYQDGGELDWFSHNKRDGGKVVNMSGNNGNATYHETTALDNGSWSVRNATGIILGSVSSHSKEEKRVVEESLDTILSEFDAMSKPIVENYPKTAKWYKEKREEVKEVAQKEIDPEEKNRRRIEALENQVASLEKRNGELTRSLSQATIRLGKAVGFIEQVKKSPVGKVFFGKKIRTFEEDSKTLPEGKGERE
jgi:hypothetical protein